MNTPTLETDRLILRKFTKEDLPAFYSIFSDKEINVYLPWFPVLSIEEAKSFYLERYEHHYSQERGYKYAICLKSDDVPIGYVSVDLEDSHDLGYGLLKEFWHKGIAIEAYRAVIDKVKADGCPYITATHDRLNIQSGRVMQALGMSYKYSYEELWQPKNFLVVFRMYQFNLDGNENRVYKKYWNMYEKHFVEDI